MATSTTTEALRVLIHALDQAGDVLDHVHADDVGNPTPCDEWDVGALADHLVQAPQNFLVMMRGDQPDWSAPTPHLTERWAASYRVHADDLIHAWHMLDGDPPVPASWQVAELAVHTWDLATAIGFPLDRLDPEVAKVGIEFMRENMTPERRGHAFGEEVEAPADAGPYDALAAFAGRQV
jgi:uncharacterized protein (TIGR03086 family)